MTDRHTRAVLRRPILLYGATHSFYYVMSFDQWKGWLELLERSPKAVFSGVLDSLLTISSKFSQVRCKNQKLDCLAT